jgi:hypothetical protein
MAALGTPGNDGQQDTGGALLLCHPESGSDCLHVHGVQDVERVQPHIGRFAARIGQGFFRLADRLFPTSLIVLLSLP